MSAFTAATAVAAAEPAPQHHGRISPLKTQAWDTPTLTAVSGSRALEPPRDPAHTPSPLMPPKPAAVAREAASMITGSAALPTHASCPTTDPSLYTKQKMVSDAASEVTFTRINKARDELEPAGTLVSSPRDAAEETNGATSFAKHHSQPEASNDVQTADAVAATSTQGAVPSAGGRSATVAGILLPKH